MAAMRAPWTAAKEHRSSYMRRSLATIASRGVHYFFTIKDVEACEAGEQRLQTWVEDATSEWKALIRIGRGPLLEGQPLRAR
eukprot:6158733-Pleurochrysis_carterae.AAC.1